MKCGHPGNYIVIEAEIYGREQTKYEMGGVKLLKPEVRQITVWQARLVQCLKCLQVYELNPAIHKENRN